MSKDFSFNVIQFAGYTKPEPYKDQFQGWVLNGKNNSFYQYIIDMMESPTNGSINKTYTDLILGRGLAYKTTPGGSITAARDWARLQSILTKKDLRGLVTDYQTFGACTFEVIQKNSTGLENIKHLPKNKVVPAIDRDKNLTPFYWVSKDWAKYSMTENTPEQFPAFGSSKKPTEIYYLKPYSVGMEFFESPDYVSGLQSAEAEIEISNLNINAIKNGLSAGFIINVENGDSFSVEQRKELKRKIEDRLTGSMNGGSFIISFNGSEVKFDVVPFPTNEQAHKQWESLNSTAASKIMSSHRVISPSIVGLSSSSGFSSVSDEMDMAEKQTIKRVIRPKQDAFLDALKEILAAYDIFLDLYFKPLTEEKTVEPVQMSEHVCLSDVGPNEEAADKLISFGFDSVDDYKLLCGSEVDYKTDDDLFGLLKFATSTGTARPLAKSSQDSEDIKILYRYVGNPLPERMFCKKMMLANKLYRKEDILQMNKTGINDGFQKGGKSNPGGSYSIWEWKGGGKMSTAFPNGTCKHKWNREIYLRKGSGLDPRSPLAETISTSESRRKGYFVPTNDSDVSIAPHSNK